MAHLAAYHVMRMPRALAAQHLRLLSSAAAAASGAAVSQDVSFTSPGNAGSPGADADAVVIGAGVLGLAIARELALAGRSVLLLEAAGAVGTETSSRNSEVIHAGEKSQPRTA